MFLISLFFLFILGLFLIFLFFLASKMSSWENLSSSVFECGFTSWFFSRFSFSIHYFMVGLIFLFLDLELCLILPLFSSSVSGTDFFLNFFLFLSCLILGLVYEWQEGKLNWYF